ncbi:MAG: glycosyltransferase family 2 protein, partial [Thermoleophilaceae bacterium]
MADRARPEASVVVATHNRRDRLAAMLESLRAQTLEPTRFEIVVVDDASSDETPALLEREAQRPGPALRVTRQELSRGPAAARNAGWRAARGGLVAFIDDDCIAAAGWLEAGLAAHAQSPGAFVQGPVGPIPHEAERRGPFTRTVTVDSLGPYYQTCNIFYPRELLERLDGFDETFPNPGGEDTDLAWRAIEAGVEPVWAGDAAVHHAVNRFDLEGLVQLALRWAPSMEVYLRHPKLREEVF